MHFIGMAGIIDSLSFKEYFFVFSILIHPGIEIIYPLFIQLPLQIFYDQFRWFLFHIISSLDIK